MRTLALLLSVLFPSLLGAATYPNYFVTNASPFSVVSGASMYVPNVYSTNMVTTNLTVTDYLFIGTAQINYLNSLGNVTASNFNGSAWGLTNVGVVAYLETNWVNSPTLGTNVPSGILLANAPAGHYELSVELVVTNFTSWDVNATLYGNFSWTYNGASYNVDNNSTGLNLSDVTGVNESGWKSGVFPLTSDASDIGWQLNNSTLNSDAAGQAFYILKKIR